MKVESTESRPTWITITLAIGKVLLKLLAAGLVIVVVIAVLLGATLFSRRVSALDKLATNQEKWRNSGISDYSITLHVDGLSVFRETVGYYPGTTLIVRNGHVVSVANSPCEKCALSNFEHFTIEGLFDDAAICAPSVLFCSVEYDPQYGFPAKSFGGFVEGSGFVVDEFQVLQSEG